jgi:NADPH:quinone reductase-like Zn-dependent oxidoreductase
MQAIVARDRAAGIDGLALAEMPYPHAAENNVIVRVHAAGFTPGELDWAGTWTGRAGHDRTPTIPGHEVSGVVVKLGYGTTGLTVRQRMFGVTDRCRNGTLAEFVAIEARNLAPLSAGVDHAVAAALPISGLTAWQGLFVHGRLTAGQTVLIHGAAGGVGSIAVQLAREAGARVIGIGRTAHRQTVLGLGAEVFVDLDRERLENIGEVDMVFDVIGGQIVHRSAMLVRSGGALASIAEPPRAEPDNGRAIFFVVEPDRAALAALERRLQDGRLRLLVGAICPLEGAPAAFDPTHRSRGKTIVRVIDDAQPTTDHPTQGDGKRRKPLPEWLFRTRRWHPNHRSSLKPVS